MKRITIDPITRLEGHGKIEIFLDDEGSVANAYFQIPELRGFEKFVEGLPVEEVPRIVTRICGVCPAAHHMASGKAVDAVYHVDPPPTAKKLRELYYTAHFVHSHIAHFYALAAPDFVVGPDAPPAKRNILGVVEEGRHRDRQRGDQAPPPRAGDPDHRGRGHPPGLDLPGGVTKGLTEEERAQIVEKAKSCVEFAKFSLQLFDDVVLKNKAYLDLILSDVYELDTATSAPSTPRTGSTSTTATPRGGPSRQGDPRYKDTEYLEHIAEHVEPYTYLKFPYLKKLGWKGLVDGPDSGVYQAARSPA